MKLNTERLTIIPLNLEQFKLLLNGVDSMERALELNSSGEHLDGHTQEAMEGLYEEAKKHEENYLWYTNWQIILKQYNLSIGSACFMGCPDNSGTVEIGYGINEKYRCSGYMTEAVKSICKWALSQKNTLRVTAETEKNNAACQRVLQKCEFIEYKGSSPKDCKVKFFSNLPVI